MKKILNEWKFFLKENRDFEPDEVVRNEFVNLLLGRIDYPQIYQYTNPEVYQTYVKLINNHSVMLDQENQLAMLEQEKNNFEKRTPERKKILKKITSLGNQMGNIRAGLSYYWNKFGGEKAARFIIEQKLAVFLAQLTPEQVEHFRESYGDYFDFQDATQTVAFPSPLPRKTFMVDKNEVQDVWIVNDGMRFLIDTLSHWSQSGEV